jgi:flagellar hook-basal body complex protein FliE
MIHLDPHANPIVPSIASPGLSAENTGGGKNGFSDAVQAMCKYVSKVDDLQQGSDASIQELLTGENGDITSVVSAVAKADVSFKVLVGIRNKLIEAYKQTMNMPL